MSDSSHQSVRSSRDRSSRGARTSAGSAPSAARTDPAARRSTRGLNRQHVGELMVQLADLIEAGCPVSRALEAVSRQVSHRPLAALASSLHSDIVNGASLAAAMERHDAFTTVEVSMIRAAEAGGFLQRTLTTLAEHAARQRDAIRRIQARLAYPAVLAVTAAASVIFLLAYIVPQFTRVYRDAGQVLPAPTRVLLAVSGFLSSYWVVLVLAVVTIVVAWRGLLRSDSFRYRWDAIFLRVPVLAPLIRNWELARFGQTMSLLLGGGVPAVRALRLTAGGVGRLPIREEVERLAAAVEQGEALSGPMAHSRFFDPTVKEMIVVSEASGKLASVLERLADQRQRDFRARADALLALAEPAIILVIGVVVGLTVIALLLPVLYMNTLIAG